MSGALGGGVPPSAGLAHSLGEYFGCRSEGLRDALTGPLSAREGYFTFGGATCFGRLNGLLAAEATGELPETSHQALTHSGTVHIPFNLSEVVTNLREERYPQALLSPPTVTGSRAARSLYYLVRPLLPVGIRKHLQRLRLSGWDAIQFPRWPVDTSVERLMRAALALAMKSQGVTRLPFIWFWPDAAPGCVAMTHDVEGPVGRRFCPTLMNVDDEAGIRSAFQVIPDVGDSSSADLIGELRARNFEVNIHDLNHDGYLFTEREQFLGRAAQINAYARQFQSRGFRAGAMYREQRWFDAFDFEYDMSVPNVAHLEPQRGGCCTVLPYFIGGLLELPLTTTQDYSLFHILGDYSTALWERQTELILEQHGFVSFITHPDYLAEPRALAVYRQLLKYLCRLRDDRRVWMALPGEVNDWWRSRREMKLVAAAGGSWRIEGPGSERARVAYAELDGDRVEYRLA